MLFLIKVESPTFDISVLQASEFTTGKQSDYFY